MTLTWQFDIRNVDDDIGWNNATITSFRNNKLKSLTCEILQNSMDNPDGSGKPVRISFQEKHIPATKFPDLDGLESHILACAEPKTLTRQLQDSQKEIKTATEVVKAEKIVVLEVSDYNTSGMEGPDEKGKPFHSYIKTEGNQSGGENRGGSHGHGKAAPLAMSQLRTILVSTAWTAKNGSLKKLFQGRATLTTHQLGSKNFDFKGYLGAPDFKALQSLPKKYSWLEREEQSGTTIRLLGWSSPKFWSEVVVGYAISIYFAAILRGRLEIDVGKYHLNRDTIHSFLSNDDFMTKVERMDTNCLKELKLAQWFMQCMDENHSGVINEDKQLNVLGMCRIKLIVDDDAPKKFGILRNDILITSSLSTYYQRHPATIKNYVGLAECLDKKGFNFLRRMEPPQHNDFLIDMLDESDRKRGGDALYHLGQGLRGAVKKYATVEVEEGASVSWLAPYFGDIAGDGRQIDETEDIDPSGKFLFTPKPKAPPPPKILWDIEVPKAEEEEEDQDEEELDEDVEIDENDPKPRPPKPTPPDPDPKDEPTEIITKMSRVENLGEHTRFIAKSENEGVLVIRAMEEGSYKVELFEVGADTNEPLTDIKLENSLRNGGQLFLQLNKGVNRVKLKLDRKLLGGVKTILSRA